MYGPNVSFKTILYCYGEKNALKNIPGDVLNKLTLHAGIPDNITSLPIDKPAIICFDDLYTQVFNNTDIVNLFVNSIHHSDISVVLTSQNLFPREKNARVLALNSQYVVFCPSPRTNSQFACLASQITGPGERQALMQAYRDHLATTTQTPFVLDLHPCTPNWCRYKANLFENDECSIVYCPQKYYNDQKFTSEITTFDGVE